MYQVPELVTVLTGIKRCFLAMQLPIATERPSRKRKTMM